MFLEKLHYIKLHYIKLRHILIEKRLEHIPQQMRMD